MIKEWRRLLTLPGYLVQVITDIGMVETYEDDKLIDSEDLRIAVELSGGHIVVVPPGARLVPDDDGNICIEVLKEVNE